MTGKEKFLKAMDISSCRRCIMRCQKRHDEIAHKYIAGKWPTIKEAPDPSLILWSNLGKGKIDRCGRQTISNALSFILLLVSFGLIIWLLDKQDQYKTDTEACGDLEIAEEDAFSTYLSFLDFNTQKNSCYCL